MKAVALKEESSHVRAAVYQDTPALARARDLWAHGQSEQALEAFDAIVEQEPNNVRALVDFATVMGTSYQVEFAEELLDQAASLLPQIPSAVASVANAYRTVFRLSRAIQVMEHYRSQDRLTPQDLAQLAIFYEQHGELDVALERIEQCLVFAPEVPELRLIRARLCRRQKRFADASKDLVALTEDDEPLLRVRALIELAHVLDAQEDYAGAFQKIEAARSIQRTLRTNGGASVQQLRERNDHISCVLADTARRVTKDDLQSWYDTDQLEPQCTAFMLGFPRSGTTLLHRLISSHPDLVVSPETAIFTSAVLPWMKQGGDLGYENLKSLNAQKLNAVQELYWQAHESVLGRPVGGRRLVDKNPSLTSMLPWLLRLAPRATWIIPLRDPRDAILSNYFRYAPLNEYSASMLSLEDAARQWVRDLTVWSTLREKLIGAWVEVQYEEVVRDPQLQINRVWEACGLDASPAFISEQPESSPAPLLLNSPSEVEAKQPVYAGSIGRWRNYEPWMAPALDVLEEFDL